MDIKKKLAILGLGGLTGFRIAQYAKKDFELFGTYNQRNPALDFLDSKKVDISNFSNLENLLLNFDPDIIVNAIALNSVDYCETFPDKAMKINYEFVKSINEFSTKNNCKLVHLSTDSVFDGLKKEPYIEEDIPNPNNQYGKSKLLGEQEVLKNSSSLIIRASVLYGWLSKNISNLPSSSMKSENFGMWLIKNLEQKKTVNIITDELSTPIIADDFAHSILHLILKNESGIFHSAPITQMNRYEFSIKLAEHLGYNSKLIQPVTRKNLGRNVKTGQNKCLDSSKLQKTGYQFLTIEESFKLIKQQLVS